MNHTQWTPEVRATWEKLESFQLNDNKAVFDYSARLAKENGWSRAFTARVIQEYKRFLLLAVHAGHPVSPSEPVDQAWHLHLVYTRSYWQRLCGEVLGRPLHHEPTAGGVDEGAKFHRQYERTLDSYRRLFGTPPPADIWPCADEAFKPKLNRWVDVSRHWTLPKTVFLRHFRPRVLVPAAAALVLVVTLAGCRDLNVFDYQGEQFLMFYIGALFAAVIGSKVLAGIFRRTGPGRLGDEDLRDPYEIAFLGGGGRRLGDAALAALYTRGLLRLETLAGGALRMGTVAGKNVDDLSLTEHQVWRALPQQTPAEMHHVRRALVPVTTAMQDKLAQLGYVFSPAGLSRLRWVAALPFLFLMGIGVVKLFVGFSRGRPVAFLVVALVVTLVVMIARLTTIRRRTAAGEAMWQRLSTRELNRRKGSVAGVADSVPFDPGHAALAVAMMGSSVLAGPAYEPMHRALWGSQPAGSSGNSSSSASSGGCGSGCGSGDSGGGGGGGGSGCGGGGCGGCGGGGGD